MPTQKTTSEEWNEDFIKDFNLVFPTGRKIEENILLGFLLSKTNSLILQKQKEILDRILFIHKKLESEYCGSINDIKLGIKLENPHTFVIEIIQTAKEKLNIDL